MFLIPKNEGRSLNEAVITFLPIVKLGVNESLVCDTSLLFNVHDILLGCKLKGRLL